MNDRKTNSAFSAFSRKRVGVRLNDSRPSAKKYKKSAIGIVAYFKSSPFRNVTSSKTQRFDEGELTSFQSAVATVIVLRQMRTSACPEWRILIGLDDKRKAY